MLVGESALVLVIPNESEPWDTQAVLKRAAQRVREWRRLHGEMSQQAFAALAGVSVGCLQDFERARRKTRDTHLLKIAAAIGATLEELIRDDDPPVKPNPLLADLKPEDLQIAKAYHHSGADVKYAVKRFFAAATSDERRERLAVWLTRLLSLDDAELAHQELLVTGSEHRPSAPSLATSPSPRTHSPK